MTVVGYNDAIFKRSMAAVGAGAISPVRILRRTKPKRETRVQAG